jgi:hypothetical protein
VTVLPPSDAHSTADVQTHREQSRQGSRAPVLFLVGGSLLVLAVRLLYLARFGWDAGWMNWGYLAYGKAIALHGTAAMQEPPLTPLLLFAARRAGLDALHAVGAVYLLAHLGLALGTLLLGHFIWPGAAPRRQRILLLLVAFTPLLSTVAGYRNLGVLVGAACLVLALALAFSVTARPVLSPLLLCGATLVALLAGAARFEALAGVLSGGVVLFALGRRLRGLPWPRAAATALLVGGLLGAWGADAFRRPQPGLPPPARDYALYTFYDGLPYLLWPKHGEDDDEFARYRTSMKYFGSHADNHGSLARALLTHPGAALLRSAAKPFDFLGALGWVGSLTPVGLFFLWLGLRKVAWRGPPTEGGLPRAWALLAYAGPWAVLWVPTSAPAYFVMVAPPLLLAIARGVDRSMEHLGGKTQRLLGVCAVVTGVLAVAFFGKQDIANSPVFNQAAAFLEARCAQGCVVNFLPQPLRTQTWVDLEAKSTFPRISEREDRVLEAELPEVARGYAFAARVQHAREAGFAGPVLYVQSRVHSFTAFHPVFDQELRWEGTVDLEAARSEARFVHGDDEVLVYAVSNP